MAAGGGAQPAGQPRNNADAALHSKRAAPPHLAGREGPRLHHIVLLAVRHAAPRRLLRAERQRERPLTRLSYSPRFPGCPTAPVRRAAHANAAGRPRGATKGEGGPMRRR